MVVLAQVAQLPPRRCGLHVVLLRADQLTRRPCLLHGLSRPRPYTPSGTAREAGLRGSLRPAAL